VGTAPGPHRTAVVAWVNSPGMADARVPESRARTPARAALRAVVVGTEWLEL